MLLPRRGLPSAPPLRALFAVITLALACRDASAPPKPAKLALSTAPSTAARSRILLPAQPVVQLQDSRGRPVKQGGVEITVAVVSGDATAGGTTTVATGADGKATFTDLTLSGKVGALVVEFSSPSLESVTAAVTLRPGDAALIQEHDGNRQSAIAGSDVATPPSVKVTDADDNAIEGREVTFGVFAGEGSVTGASAMTNSEGIARVGGWTLSKIAGTNQLIASLPGVTGSPVIFNATGLAGPPARMVLLPGSTLSAPANTALPGAVLLGIRDQYNNPVATSHTVSFALLEGGGSLAATTATSDLQGTVVTPQWRLGKSAVLQWVRASIPALPDVPPLDIGTTVATRYRIDVRFFGPPVTQAQQDLFSNAARRLEGIVTGDLADALAQNVDLTVCGIDGVAPLNGTIDDLLIYAAVGTIDGPGAVLAYAGPCYVRGGAPGHVMPVVGVMNFDAADIATLDASGNLQDVIMHEMLHVLGVGVLWEDRNHLVNAGTANPRYIGGYGVAGCQGVGGTVTCALSVPVENTGGAGTADSHWRESTFNNELMTGFLDSGVNPISRMTIGSLADLGYAINAADYDDYTIPGGMLRAGTSVPLVRGEWERRPTLERLYILQKDGSTLKLTHR